MATTAQQPNLSCPLRYGRARPGDAAVGEWASLHRPGRREKALGEGRSWPSWDTGCTGMRVFATDLEWRDLLGAAAVHRSVVSAVHEGAVAFARVSHPVVVMGIRNDRSAANRLAEHV